jgi:hypothetical protein
VPDYVEAFPNDVSYLSAAADGSQLAISNGHKILSVRVSHVKVHAASAMYALMKTAQALVLNLPVMYAVLDTTLSSKLKLPVDWPAIKVPALSRRVQSHPRECV